MSLISYTKGRFKLKIRYQQKITNFANICLTLTVKIHYYSADLTPRPHHKITVAVGLDVVNRLEIPEFEKRHCIFPQQCLI